MHLNSEGNSPSLRAQLGVGWNRALPAPFGFNRSFDPDGVNDCLVINHFNALNFPSVFTLSFWFNGSTGLPGFVVYNNSYLQTFTIYQSAGNIIVRIRSGLPGSTVDQQLFSVAIPANRVYAVFRFYVSGNLRLSLSHGGTALIYDAYSVYGGLTATMFPQSIQEFRIGYSSTGSNTGPGSAQAAPIDEFQLYNSYLSDSDIRAIYNAGVGNNPIITENLYLWYQFEEFESLDFSVAQDGSDMRTGIRDMSNNKRHAQQFNCDTNPASGTYCLQPSLI